MSNCVSSVFFSLTHSADYILFCLCRSCMHQRSSASDRFGHWNDTRGDSFRTFHAGATIAADTARCCTKITKSVMSACIAFAFHLALLIVSPFTLVLISRCSKMNLTCFTSCLLWIMTQMRMLAWLWSLHIRIMRSKLLILMDCSTTRTQRYGLYTCCRLHPLCTSLNAFMLWLCPRQWNWSNLVDSPNPCCFVLSCVFACSEIWIP